MPISNCKTLEGVIEVTTPDGASAIVKLDRPVDGVKRAVIGPETVGRIELMNGKGRIQEGAHVVGQAERGPQAFSFRTIKFAS